MMCASPLKRRPQSAGDPSFAKQEYAQSDQILILIDVAFVEWIISATRS